MKHIIHILILLFCANFAKAQHTIDSLKIELAHTHSPSDSIRLMNQIGIAYIQKQTTENDNISRMYLENSIRVANRIHAKKASAHSTVLYGVSFITKDNRIADSFIHSGIRVASEIGDSGEVAFGVVKLAILHMDEDSLVAEAELQRALSIYNKIIDTAGLTTTKLHLGHYYSRHGDYKKAIENKLDALKEVEKKGNNISLGYLLMELGTDYQFLKNFDLALQYDLRAEKVFKAVGAEQFTSTILFNIGTIYEAKKDFSNALTKYNEALLRYQKFDDTKNTALTLCQIGGIYLNVNNFDMANSYLIKSAKLVDSLNDNETKMALYDQLATMYIQQNNRKRALDLLYKKAKIAQLTGELFNLFSAYQRISKVHAEMNDFESAYKYYVLYTELKDSLFNNEKAKQITEIQSKYDLNNKEKTIELLNKNKEIMQARLSRKNITIISFVVGASLLIIVLILLFNRRMLINKNKYTQTLNDQQKQFARSILSAQEDERHRIAKDMHDSLGAYLSSLRINMEVIEPVIPEDKKVVYGNLLTGLQKVTGEVRAITNNLVSDTLRQFGLIIAIEELVELLNRTGKIEIDYKYSNTEIRYEAEYEAGIFRIVQEMINNTLKHAQATQIFLEISLTNNKISIDFKDNGKGFDWNNEVSEKKGLGLRNLEARTKILNGTFGVDAKNGKGVSYKIEISVT